MNHSLQQFPPRGASDAELSLQRSGKIAALGAVSALILGLVLATPELATPEYLTETSGVPSAAAAVVPAGETRVPSAPPAATPQEARVTAEDLLQQWRDWGSYDDLRTF